MKSFKLILLSSFLLILSISHGQGSGDLILVREDIVKPYLADEYEYALMDLTAHYAEIGEEEIRYVTHVQDNFHYTHFREIDGLDDIQSCMFTCTHGKEESAECSLIFEFMHDAIETTRAYIVELDKDLSYIPDDESWMEDNLYRRWSYYYFTPGSSDEVRDILSSWKYLYEKYAIESGYRVYKGVIGIDQPVIIFTTWATNPLEHQQNLDDNINILGEEGSALLLGMLELCRKVETVDGWFIPEFSYTP